jgi:hypothetical protein
VGREYPVYVFIPPSLEAWADCGMELYDCKQCGKSGIIIYIATGRVSQAFPEEGVRA